MGQISLAHDSPAFRRELLEWSSFPAYVVAVKELLGAGVSVSEPGVSHTDTTMCGSLSF
jgi:hypothetical protein